MLLDSLFYNDKNNDAQLRKSQVFMLCLGWREVIYWTAAPSPRQCPDISTHLCHQIFENWIGDIFTYSGSGKNNIYVQSDTLCLIKHIFCLLPGVYQNIFLLPFIRMVWPDDTCPLIDDYNPGDYCIKDIFIILWMIKNPFIYYSFKKICCTIQQN